MQWSTDHFRRFEQFAIFRRFGNQQILGAMNGRNSEKAGNKMRSKVTNLRTIESKYFNNLI